jgi:hypothetical protein
MTTPDALTVTAPQHTPSQWSGDSTARHSRISAQRLAMPTSYILGIFAGNWASTHWSSLKPQAAVASTGTRWARMLRRAA